MIENRKDILVVTQAHYFRITLPSSPNFKLHAGEGALDPNEGGLQVVRGRATTSFGVNDNQEVTVVAPDTTITFKDTTTGADNEGTTKADGFIYYQPYHESVTTTQPNERQQLDVPTYPQITIVREPK